MTTKASAEWGGQAAIGDIINKTSISSLIGQLTGNSTVVIHNLHITNVTKAANEPSAGLIAYFGLTEWWFSVLSKDERGAIEDAIGDDVCKTSISTTNRTASSWLRSVALRIGIIHQNLASKLRAKASFLEFGIDADDYWQRQLDIVRRHWARLDFESAREELWAVGSRMREENALPEARIACSDLLASLMRADPYYAEVMECILPIITTRPGIVQSVLAKGFPQFDIHRFRHAMYYGEIIGDIRRVKRGNSYGLFGAMETSE